jgi:predicted dehydrogenase
MKNKRTLGVALIGHRFMGRAHSNAWRQAPRFFDLPADLRLKTICGRDQSATAQAARQLGWEQAETDWRRVMQDPEIDIVDICTPNDSHGKMAVAAAGAGKAILCEKPLARNVPEAQMMVRAVHAARVPNMVCHNYRRIPAVVLAREMIEAGAIGQRIFHFRARYAQDWIVDPNFPLVWRLQSAVSGSGALGDIFSHVADLARYLVAEFHEVCAATETFVKRRPIEKAAGRRSEKKSGKVNVDDAVTMIGRFRNGALASIEATRFAPGRKNSIVFEVNGSEGSLAFDFEEMNKLHFFSRRDPPREQGFREIIVTEPSHPYSAHWWPSGHLLGYEHTFVHTIADFVKAVVARRKAMPDFEDGLKTQKVLAAVAKSAGSKRWVTL